MFLILFFSLFFSAQQSVAGILPDIFDASESEQSALCQSPKSLAPVFWSQLMQEKIESWATRSTLQGIEQDVYRNQLVTASYLALFERGHDTSSNMGYVYANASHHLGRLVRFHFWKTRPSNEIQKADQILISGNILGTSIRLFPLQLSRLLMNHSLNLYKTLSWGLAAQSICGQTHVQKMLAKDSGTNGTLFPGLPLKAIPELMVLLKKAYDSHIREEFISNFLAYEQTYLQYTMYASQEVKFPTSIGVLDEMRFIPFNGEKQNSFFEWCLQTECKQTSLNLKNRILFDQTVVLKEFEQTEYNHLLHQRRLQNAQLKDVQDLILNDFCNQNQIPSELCL